MGPREDLMLTEEQGGPKKVRAQRPLPGRYNLKPHIPSYHIISYHITSDLSIIISSPSLLSPPIPFSL